MGKPVEKRKKKGRPSLLDLQKRSLRLQKQQEEQQRQKKRNASPSSNPHHRFPASAVPGCRSTRQEAAESEVGREDAEDEEEEEKARKGVRREKKLKLVLRLHQSDDGSRAGIPQPSRRILDSSGSESKGAGSAPVAIRKIDAVDGEGSGQRKTDRQHAATKETEGDPSHTAPTTTPLPDKKLLEFILDRLQKKDTYGVFSQPVDPDELPDYHEVIEHPMDFGTVRKRLSSRYYKNLERFEKDVFLISSNAMSYNAPDTIYFRQARSIQELAKKDFENLRQDSGEDEPEPRPVRRGRPPSKSTARKAAGRPPERAASDFSSDAVLATTGRDMKLSSFHDLSRKKGFSSDKQGSTGALTQANRRQQNETSFWMVEKQDRREDAVKGAPARAGKKAFVLDENRRNTYKQSFSTSWRGPSIPTTYDRERKLLLPVGLHGEHAYARSLAKFAANLGPAGWAIVAEQIEKVLPPGTKFGRGWVGQPDASPPSLHPGMSNSSAMPTEDAISSKPQLPPSSVAPDDRVASSAPSCANLNIAPNPVQSAVPARESTADGGGCSGDMRPRPPLQPDRNAGAVHVQPVVNGFHLQHARKMLGPTQPTVQFVPDVPTTRARAVDVVSRGNGSSGYHPSNHGAANPKDQTAARKPLSPEPKPGPAPLTDLIVKFQSPASPPSGVAVDSQQPDLALQL